MPATSDDWRAFGSSLQGRLAVPSSPGYAVDAQSYNPVFDEAHPQGIAYCASAVRCRDRQSSSPNGMAWSLSVRSGGHCYGGWSTGPGLVIDVSPMNEVDYQAETGLVSVGSGTRLIDLYAGLAPHGVAVPGGSCPSVGIAGLALGGGLGVLGRKFGLTCDNLESAEVVLASGETVTCDATHHSDLFWALRGGGGGSFGVVTQFSFSTHPIGSLGLFTLGLALDGGGRRHFGMAGMGTGRPRRALVELSSRGKSVHAIGRGAGRTGDRRLRRLTGRAASLVDELVGEVEVSPYVNFVGLAAYLDTMLIEAGCENDTVAECHLPSQNPAGLLGRSPFVAKSNIVETKLSAQGVATLLDAVEQRQASPVLYGGGFVLDAAGGAINRVAPDATAYVHRSSLASLQYSAGWAVGSPPSVVAANRQWIETAWQSMRPYVSTGAYSNYADPDLVGWQQAYWGSNFTRLTEVKRAYDPANLFHFPQSVPPA